MADFVILEENSKNSGDESLSQNNLGKTLNSFLGTPNPKVPVKVKVVFFRLLATMINSGITLLKSIAILKAQEKNKALKKILGKVEEILMQGGSLSEAMSMFPRAFSNAEIGMIKSGEKTGKLNSVLRDLSAQIEKVSSISGKIKAAMIYPAAIIVVILGVVMVVIIFVVPKLLEAFGSSDNLPPSTRFLLFLSELFKNYWYVILFIIGAIITAIKYWKNTTKGRYLWDSFMLKMPVFGQLQRKVILSKFARVFSGLLSSGISIVEAMKIVAEAVGNEVYRQRILLLGEDIKHGLKIWESLDADPLFPDMMVQMIQVGEQTAKLDEIIIKVADFYDEEVDNTVSIINKLLEPFILIFLAVAVGGIAISILQPIMGMSDAITQG